MDNKLHDTIPMMESEDFKERFRAEYFQLFARYEKLSNMIQRWDKGELDFEPKTDRFLLNLQLRAMRDYLEILVERAEIEGVDISSTVE